MGLFQRRNGKLPLRNDNTGCETAEASPGLYAFVLEPRMMFDGAAAATAAEVQDPASSDPQNASEPSATDGQQAQSSADTPASAEATAPAVPAPIELRPADPEANGGRREAAFIDTGVADWQTLADGIRDGVEVVLIDSSQSGLAQIARWAETHSGYDAIHVLSHGSEGTLHLGRDTLTDANLGDAAIQVELAQLGQALTAEGDLLVYGCNVASGEAGREFIVNLAAATGADVAASEDATGAGRLGGDWNLEAAAGAIETYEVLSRDFMTSYDYILALPSATQNFGDAYWTNNTGGNTADGFSLAASPGATRQSSASSLYFSTTTQDGNGNYYYEVTWTADNTDLGTFDLNAFKIQNFGGPFTLLFTGSNGATQTYSSGAAETVTIDINEANFNDITSFTIKVTQNTGAGTLNMDLQQMVLADLKAPDVTAPTFDTAPAASSVTTTGFTASASIDEAGTIYYVVVADGAAAPTAAEVEAGTASGGGAALKSGSGAASTNPYDGSFAITGLSSGTAYDLYMVAKDTAGNRMASPTKVDVTTTAASAAPTLTATGGTVTHTEDGSAVDLFSGVTAAVNDAGQTFSGMTLTVANVGDGSAEILSIGGTDVPLTATGGTPIAIAGGGSAAVTVVGGTATVTITGMNRDDAAMGTLIDGITYRNTSQTPSTASDRVVTITQIADSGGSNNTASPNIAATVSVDSVADVTSVSIANGGRAGNTTYRAGDNIDVTVNFDQAVTVAGGTPTLALDVGGVSRTAAYVSGSGTTALVFRYAVQAGDADTNGVDAAANGIALAGATIRDTAGTANDAALSYSLVNNASAKVDTTAPSSATGVLSIAENAANGSAVGTVSATDAASVTYSLTDNAGGRFAIDANTGAVTVADGSLLDYESTTSHSITVRATDAAGNTTDTGLTVTVTNVNENPTGSGALTATTLADNAGATALFGSLAVSDPDAGENDLSLTVTLSNSAAGTLSGGGFTTSDGGTTYTLTGLSVAAANTALDNLRFTPANNTGSSGSFTTNFTVTVNDQGGGGERTVLAATTVTVNRVNDAPTVSGAPTYTTDENTAVAMQVSTILGGVTRSDADNDTLGIAVTAASGNGTWQFSTNSTNGADGTWTAFGAVADATALMLAPAAWVRYVPDGQNGESAGLTFRAWDQTSGSSGTKADATSNGGATAFSSGAVSASLTVTAVNDLPVIDLDVSNGGSTGFAAAFSAGGSAVAIANGDATVLDVDTGDNIESLTAVLDISPDGANETLGLNAGALAAATGAGLTVGYDAGTRTLTVSGTASAATYQTILRGLVYGNTDAPASVTTGARNVTVTVSDGSGNSNTATSVVTVVTAPIVDLNGAGAGNDGTAGFTEGAGATLVAASAGLTDPDGDNLNQLVIRLTNAQNGGAESIALSGGAGVRGGITVTYDSATQITLSGADTAANYQALLRELQYNNTSEAPNTTDRTITVQGRDVSGYTGASSAVTVSVTAVNDAPTFAGLDGSPSYTENGAAAVLDANATVADTELDAADSYAGATLTLARNGGANAQDTFSASGLLGTLTEGGNLVYSGSTIGTVTTNSGGTLVLTFNADATAAQVDGVLQSIAYANSSDAPPASVQINWTFSDGNGGGQGSGGALAATGNTTVSITSVNDAPTSSAAPAIGGGTTVGGTAFSASTGTWSDAEGDTLTYSYQWQRADDASGTNAVNIAGATGSSYTATGAEAHKYLRVVVTANDGQGHTPSAASAWTLVTNSAPANTAAPAVTMATVGSQASVTSGTWSDADADALTYTYQWQRADDASGTNAVNIAGATGSSYTLTGSDAHKYLRVTVTANDSQGSSDRTAHSAWTQATNSLPALGGTFTTSGAVNDNATLAPFANVTVSDADGDVLSIAIAYTAANGTLSGAGLSGSAGNYTLSASDLSTLQSRLQSLVFTPTSNQAAPGGTVATVFTLTPGDGIGNGAANASTQVTVTSINDAPSVAAALADQTANEDQPFSFTVPAEAFADVDAGDSLTYTATLADGSALPAWLSFNAATRAFSGTPAQSDVGSLNVKVTATDGSGASASDTFTLTVANVNDVPVISVPASQTADEDADLAISGVSISDADAGTVRVTLSAGHGVMTLIFKAGLTFADGDGSADASMTFTGTVTDVNAALSSLVYRGNANYNGADAVSIQVNDLGNSGSGGPKTATGSIAVTVRAVNDLPTGADASIEATGGQSRTLQLQDFPFADQDGDSLQSIVITGLPDGGRLTLNGVDVTPGQTVSAADLQAGNLVFLPRGGSSAANVALVFKVGDGKNFSSESHTLHIGVRPGGTQIAVNSVQTVEFNSSTSNGIQSLGEPASGRTSGDSFPGETSGFSDGGIGGIGGIGGDIGSTGGQGGGLGGGVGAEGGLAMRSGDFGNGVGSGSNGQPAVTTSYTFAAETAPGDAISLPSDALANLDGAADVQFDAVQENGEALPSWIRFDSETGAIKVLDGADQSTTVVITAIDGKGNKAVIRVVVKTKNSPSAFWNWPGERAYVADATVSFTDQLRDYAGHSRERGTLLASLAQISAG